jgi:hypothetical protein
MKQIHKILTFFSIAVVLGSCNQVLDTEDQSAIDGNTLFEDKGLATLYLNNIYLTAIDQDFLMLENADLSDDYIGGGSYMAGVVLDPDEGTNDTPGNYGVQVFGYVRNILNFIEGVRNGSLSDDDKDELIGQAYFLRAFMYWDLVLYYGGVPIVDKILDVNDRNANLLPRSTTSECVEFITSDLDRAIEMLDGKSLEKGRVTASAAAALKGRVLMFFASPQFDQGGESSVDGVASRWQEAYQANLEAKNIAEAAGHALYPNYRDVFLVEDNEEVIMAVKFASGLSNNGYDNSVRPFSVAGTSYSGSGTPTWDFVKAFPMIDGTSIEESSAYDSTRYWEDRDPRFYSVIAYNGSNYKFNSRAGQDYQWTYEGNSQESGLLPNTGFYLRKNVNTTLNAVQSTQTGLDWVEIRYAEVLLNLAECANEAGETSVALENIYAIRERAGIEAGSGNYGITASNKADLREVIMNERRVEMCFENKRHFDLRRRNMFINGAKTLGAGLNGSRRTGILTTVNYDYVMSLAPDSASNETEAHAVFEAYIRDTVDWSDSDNLQAFFNYELEYMDAEGINFLQPKYNFYFLPTNALVRNENLQQTLRWANGTFDPLAD